jgi:hypothetical protein
MPVRRRVHARRLTAVLAAVLAASALLAIPGAETARAGASDRLPDLRMAPLGDFRIQTVNGRRLLRFTATMHNSGSAPFALRGRRSSSTSSAWSVEQLVSQVGGGTRPAPTSATMTYGGDGHFHWHINRVVDTDMWTTGRTAKGSKIGFCFFDTTAMNLSLPGAPGGPVYRESGCGGQSAVTSTMGLSVGWGDTYQWSLPFQWVDITGLPGGNYTIRSWVDGGRLFLEGSDSNNCAYSRIRFGSTGTAVSVLGSGFSCVNDYSASVHADHMRWVMDNGIIPPCGLDLFCPGVHVTRSQVARWVDRLIRLPSTTTDPFTDDEGHRDEGAINRMAAAGFAIPCGTNRYCPDARITRADLAATLTRAFGFPSTSNDYFTDDGSHPRQADINRARAAGVMFACQGETTFCPFGAVTRASFAAYLHRSFLVGGAATASLPLDAAPADVAAPVELASTVAAADSAAADALATDAASALFACRIATGT